MTSEEFASRIIGMRQTLYRVSCTELRSPHDREDAVQETIRRAWEKRDRLRDERVMQTWVIRILLNVCHDIRKRQARVMPMADMPDPTAQDGGNTLREALAQLDESFRQPIVLHYLEDYGIEEIAGILRLPVGTVKSRLARGRDKLKALLQEEVFDK